MAFQAVGEVIGMVQRLHYQLAMINTNNRVASDLRTLLQLVGSRLDQALQDRPDVFKLEEAKQFYSCVDEVRTLVERYLRPSMTGALKRYVGAARNEKLLRLASSKLNELMQLVTFILTTNPLSAKPGDQAQLAPEGEQHFIELSLLDFSKSKGFGKKIGEGGFGAVTTAGYQGDIVAVKTLTQLGAEQRESFFNEIRIMRKLLSPRVVQIFGAVAGTRPMLVMKFMPNGSLHGYYLNASKDSSSLSVFVAHSKRIVADIATGMAFLYNHDVQHRDLKSMNVLLDADSRCCLADFGLAQVVHRPAGCVTDTLKVTMDSIAGTPLWMAPELLYRRGGAVFFTEKCDVYSFGCVLYEIATLGLPPAPHNRKHRKPKLGDHCKGLQDDSAALIRSIFASCVQTDPKRRPHFTDVLRRLESDASDTVSYVEEKEEEEEEETEEDADDSGHLGALLALLKAIGGGRGGRSDLAFKENSHFAEGNQVLVVDDADTLRKLQDGNGGCTSDMLRQCGKTGTVRGVTRSGLIKVDFAEDGWYFNGESLSVLHEHTMCDGSGANPLVGIRYKKVGANYDLCETEFRKLSEAERDKYIEIRRPGVVTAANGLNLAPGVTVQLTNSDHIGALQRAVGGVHLDALEGYVEKKETGTVRQVVLYEDTVHVEFAETVYSVHPRALLVTSIIADQRVKVIDDVVVLEQLQEGHGGFNSDMKEYCGQTGKILGIDKDGDAYVRFDDDKKFFYNPVTLEVCCGSPGQSAPKHAPKHADDGYVPPYGRPEALGGAKRSYPIDEKTEKLLWGAELTDFWVAYLPAHVVAQKPKEHIDVALAKLTERGVLINKAIGQMRNGERSLQKLVQFRDAMDTAIIEQIWLAVVEMERDGAVVNPSKTMHRRVLSQEPWLTEAAEVIVSGSNDDWEQLLDSARAMEQATDIALTGPLLLFRGGVRDVATLTADVDIDDSCIVVALADRVKTMVEANQRRPTKTAMTLPDETTSKHDDRMFRFGILDDEQLSTPLTDNARRQIEKTPSLFLGLMPALITIGRSGCRMLTAHWHDIAQAMEKRGWNVERAIERMRDGERRLAVLVRFKDEHEKGIIEVVLRCVEDLERAGLHFNPDTKAERFFSACERVFEDAVPLLSGASTSVEDWEDFARNWVTPRSNHGWNLLRPLTLLKEGVRDIVELTQDCDVREGFLIEQLLIKVKAAPVPQGPSVTMRSPAASIHGSGPSPALTPRDLSSGFDSAASFFWTDVENNSRGPDSIKTLSIQYRSSQLDESAFIWHHEVTNGEWVRMQDVPDVWAAILTWRPAPPTHAQSHGHSQPATRPLLTPPKRTIALAENPSQQRRWDQTSSPEPSNAAQASSNCNRLVMSSTGASPELEAKLLRRRAKIDT